jgi:hypothetical protein
MRKFVITLIMFISLCLTAPVIGQNEPIQHKTNKTEVTYRDIQDFEESYLAKFYRAPSKHKMSKEHQIDPFSGKTYIRSKPARGNHGCFIGTILE